MPSLDRTRIARTVVDPAINHCATKLLLKMKLCQNVREFYATGIDIHTLVFMGEPEFVPYHNNIFSSQRI